MLHCRSWQQELPCVPDAERSSQKVHFCESGLPAWKATAKKAAQCASKWRIDCSQAILHSRGKRHQQRDCLLGLSKPKCREVTLELLESNNETTNVVAAADDSSWTEGNQWPVWLALDLRLSMSHFVPCSLPRITNAHCPHCCCRQHNPLCQFCSLELNLAVLTCQMHQSALDFRSACLVFPCKTNTLRVCNI